MLHSKKSIFIDEKNAGNEKKSIEDEADNFSAEFLVPSKDISAFTDLHGDSGNSLKVGDLERYARKLGVSPGLLLSRLQHEEIVSWNSRLNSKLKRGAKFA